MKTYPAIALLEFRDVTVGIYATDALVKKAPIAVLKSGTISQGRYLTLIGGTTASVLESYEEGLLYGKDSVVDHVLLPDVHPAVHDGILGRRGGDSWTGALGVIETETVACNVRAAERALKATGVDLVELRLSDSWLAGKGISIYHGDLHDIEEAVAVAVADLEERSIPALHRVITSPHEATTQQIARSTHFVGSELLDLEGEILPTDDGDTWTAPAAATRKARTSLKGGKAPARKKTAKKKSSKSKAGKKKRKDTGKKKTSKRRKKRR